MKIIGMPGSLKKLYEMLSPHCVQPPDRLEYTPVDDIEGFLYDLIDSRDRTLPQDDSTFDRVRKGATGEMMLVNGLADELRNDDCYLIHCVELPFGERCRQPDHILIHPKALAVIETKFWTKMATYETVLATQAQLQEETEALEQLLDREAGSDRHLMPVIYEPKRKLTFGYARADPRYVHQRVSHDTHYIAGQLLRRHGMLPNTNLGRQQMEHFRDILIKRMLKWQQICTCNTIVLDHRQPYH